MKINVTVDLSEFYSEEDERDFSSQIKDSISYQVKNQIVAEWKEKIGVEFNNAVKAEVEKQKEAFITNEMERAIVDSKVKKGYSGEMITISEWINEELQKAHLSDNRLKEFLNNQTKQLSDKLSKELKERYDLMFATQIINKLHENGMLNENVAKLMLPANE